MKICLITNLHLINNPRVWKEAKLLSSHGYDVSILTQWTLKDRRDKDIKLLEGFPIKYISPNNLIKGEVSSVKRFMFRGITKLSKLLKLYLKIETPWLVGFSANKMLTKALEENADLYIAHTEYGMYIGNKLIEKNKKVAYDFEDWYSHDYLVPFRPVKFLKSIERFALQHGVFCLCPSQSMAKAIQAETGCTNEIVAVYNGFSVTENPKTISEKEKKNNSLIWFSQIIGPGRGLEYLINSLSFLATNVELTLLGYIDEAYKQKLIDLFSVNSNRHTLVFHDLVNHRDLVDLLSKFNIGLALENDYPESKDTTVSNKILQYVQAGVKTVATDTQGQREVASFFPELIEVVPQNKPQEWAQAIHKLLLSGPVDQNSVEEKFANIFSLETQQKKILSLVSKALHQ